MMQNNFNDKALNQNYREDYIDLKQILNVIWNGKLYLLFIISFFSIASIFYSLSLPNIYQSKALLSPVSSENDLNSQSNYAGLANLAGINLSSQSSGSNKVKAIEKLNTLSFFSENVLPNIFLPDLMAVDYWDAKTNSIIYNSDIYDMEKQKWVRDFQFPQTQVPSNQESFEIFINNHLRVSNYGETNFIIISIKHKSPFIAQEWTEMIVSEINNFFRIRDKQEAIASIDYLNNQIAQTSFAEIKQAIAQLLQNSTQKLTLIEANDFYVFEYIDPPVVMEKKVGPKRSLICIFGGLLGAILGIFIILIRHFYTEQKT
jgi:LPS O-antigen subunit length determinant protein (WzzB/FepE family)